MSYIGSTPTTQSFIAGTDYFNGTGSQVAFTLSRSVNSVNDIEVIVNNVEQIPSGYSVSGTTLTFSAAPSAGTSNVYVRYLSTTLQSITVPAGTTVGGNFGVAGNLTVTANTTTDAVRITQLGTGNALLVEDSTNPDSTPFVINASGVNIQGYTSSITGAGGIVALSQVVSTTSAGGRQGFVYSSTTTAASNIDMAKSASPTIGTHAIVASGETLGTVRFSGSDGTNFFRAAEIGGFVDGTPGTNDMPGRLVFSTTADGASSPTERMRINSSGNLLVGTTSTLGARLAVYGTGGGDNNYIQITNPGQGTACVGLISTGSNVKFYNCYSTGTLSGGVGIDIDTSGNLLVGATSGSAQLVVKYTYPKDGANWISSSSATHTAISFNTPAGVAGTINTNTLSTSYATSSDYRLKEAIAPMTGALAKVALLKPCTYKWKIDGSDGQGFIAHELDEVVPGCVTGEKDAVDAEGNPQYQGIDTSFLVATLTAAIQEQQTLITALTARITALESK